MQTSYFYNIQKVLEKNYKDFFLQIFFSSLLLAFAIWWQNTLSIFTDISALNIPVGDIMFSIIPQYDLSVIYFVGMWSLFPLGIGYVIYKIPEKIPFIIFTFALFFFIRGICISSTYIGIPPDHITPYLNLNININILVLFNFLETIYSFLDTLEFRFLFHFFSGILHILEIFLLLFLS